MTDLETAFLFWWNMLARTPEPEQEYQFHDKRRWRFDFAWPDALVAVECEGGVWTRGRHTRGGGFERDCEKYNTATAQGWRVFRVTRGMLDRNPQRWVRMIYEAVTK